MAKNCILLGKRAGAELPEDSEYVTIIGNYVVGLDKDKNPWGSVYIGDRMVLSAEVYQAICDSLGFNLKERYDELYPSDLSGN